MKLLMGPEIADIMEIKARPWACGWTSCRILDILLLTPGYNAELVQLDSMCLYVSDSTSNRRNRPVSVQIARQISLKVLHVPDQQSDCG